MSLIDTILNAANGSAANTIALKFGLNSDQVSSVIAQLAPALTAGVKKNAQAPGGLSALVGALTQGGHTQYVDKPETLANDSTVDDGNKILGHLFGSKDVSRSVAQKVSGDTGIDTSVIKKMLPMVASLAMGAMGKQAQQAKTNGQDSSSLFTSLLDADKDGSIADDLLGMAGKFFR